MFKHLREMYEKKDKKLMANLMTAFVLGILLIVCGSTFFKDDSKSKDLVKNVTNQTPVSVSMPSSESAKSYERQLEERLEKVYSAVEGAGKVSVMVTLSYGKEIVVAEDVVQRESGNKESDNQGGTREQYDNNKQGTKIMITGRDGSSQPLVLKEIEPQVEGVIIVAQGGDDVYIQEALIRATQTVLGVEPHKVQVLKMKKLN